MKLAYLSWITLSANALLGSQNIKIEGEFRRPNLAVGKQYIYIWDSPFKGVCIYSKEGRFIRSFSQYGQGPGDLTRVNSLVVDEANIFISDTAKVSYYTFEGKLIGELTKDPGFLGVIPFGKNFVCRDWSALGINNADSQARSIAVILMNAKFKSKRILYQYYIYPRERGLGNRKTNSPIWDDYLRYIVDRDKLYLGDTSKGFFFLVFDSSGNVLSKIDKSDETKSRVTSAEKELLIGRLKELWGNNWNWWESQFNILVPKYFLPFFSFSACNGTIYVFKHPNLIENTQIILSMNTKGEVLRTKSINPLELDLIMNNEYCINNDVLYFLKPDIRTGEWYINMIDLSIPNNRASTEARSH